MRNMSARHYPYFLFIGPGFCLKLPSGSTSRWTPLLSANGSHCQAHSGLSPPSYCPCRAHEKKTPQVLIRRVYLLLEIFQVCRIPKMYPTRLESQDKNMIL